MNRIWVAVFALIFIISLCLTERGLSNKITNEITNGLDKSIILVENQKYDEAKIYAKEVQNNWKKQEGILFIFTPHDRFNTFEDHIRSLDSLLETEQYEDYIVNAKKSSETLNHINESENLKIENIL